MTGNFTKGQRRLLNDLSAKKTNHRLSVRLTESEYKEVCKASKDGISKSVFVRYALSHPLRSHRPAPKPMFTQKDYDLLDCINDTRIQLARSGNLLNQLVRDANSGKAIMPDQYMKYVEQLKTETDTVKLVMRKVVDNHG